MKLNKKVMQQEAEMLPQKEGMKYRFKMKRIYYPYLREQLIWKTCETEWGLTKRKTIEFNAKARKPYWRKKRRVQKQYKQHIRTIS